MKFNIHGYPYKIDDYAWVLGKNLNSRKGVCHSIGPVVNGEQSYYFLMDDTQELEQFLFSELYSLSSYIEQKINRLITPTPVNSPTSTPPITRTPYSSPTHTVTPSVTFVIPDNLLNNINTVWYGENGIVTKTSNTSIKLTSSATSFASPVKFSTSVNVLSNTDYNLSFNYNQGTCRNLNLNITSNTLAKIFAYGLEYDSGTLYSYNVSDSGRVNCSFRVRTDSVITITITLFGDSNYNTSVSAGGFCNITNLSMPYRAFIPSTPSATPTITPTISVTPTLTPTLSITPTITITPPLTETITPTITPMATLTPTQTSTTTPASTVTITPTVSITGTPIVTITPTITDTPSVTLTPIATITPTPSPTDMVNISVTPSPTITITATITDTPSVTATVTPTVTATVTPTVTDTPSVTATITPTVSMTFTPTVTATITPTISVSMTFTPTVTTTITPPVSATITPTATPTVTATITPTATPPVTLTSAVTSTPSALTYAGFDSLRKGTSITLSNLNRTAAASNTGTVLLTDPVEASTANRYWEITIDSANQNYLGVGIAPSTSTNYNSSPGTITNGISWYNNGTLTIGGVDQPTAVWTFSLTTPYPKLKLALKNGKLYGGIVGVGWQGDPDAETGALCSGLTGLYSPSYGMAGGTASTITINSGNLSFIDVPPIGATGWISDPTSITPTPSITPTITKTPAVTHSPTRTPSVITPTPTKTATVTPTPSVSVTPSPSVPHTAAGSLSIGSAISALPSDYITGKTTAITTQVSGSGFIVFVGTSSSTTPVITDNKSNVYTNIIAGYQLASANTGQTNRYIHAFICNNGTGGVGHIFTATLDSGYPSIFVQEIISGLSGTGIALDNYSTITDSASPYTSATLSASAVDNVMVSFLGFNTFTASVAFSSTNYPVTTKQTQIVGSLSGAVGVKMATDTSPDAAIWTATGSNDTGIFLISVKLG